MGRESRGLRLARIASLVPLALCASLYGFALVSLSWSIIPAIVLAAVIAAGSAAGILLSVVALTMTWRGRREAAIAALALNLALPLLILAFVVL